MFIRTRSQSLPSSFPTKRAQDHSKNITIGLKAPKTGEILSFSKKHPIKTTLLQCLQKETYDLEEIRAFIENAPEAHDLKEKIFLAIARALVEKNYKSFDVVGSQLLNEFKQMPPKPKPWDRVNNTNEKEKYEEIKKHNEKAEDRIRDILSHLKKIYIYPSFKKEQKLITTLCDSINRTLLEINTIFSIKISFLIPPHSLLDEFRQDERRIKYQNKVL